jgi:hypothetical protein
LTNSGTLTADANAKLWFGTLVGSTATFNGGTISGQGSAELDATMSIQSGTTVSGTVQTFALIGTGVISGAGSLNISGELDWYSGGWIQTTGTTDIKPGGKAYINSQAFLANGTFKNEGSTVVQGSSNSILMYGNSLINNSGTFDIQNDENISGTSQTFINTGTFKKSAGTGTSKLSLNFQQTGTIQAASGTLEFDRDLNEGSGQVYLLGGDIQVDGKLVIEPGASLIGTGIIAADTLENDGTITLSYDGTGFLLLNARSGVSNSGNYTQGATGTLNMKIAGQSTYDQFWITGTVTLGGTINVATVGGYTPGQATVFTLLQFGSRPNPNTNKFGTENFPDTTHWSSGYGTSTYTVTYSP